MAIVTTQELEDAARDVQDLGKVVNDPEGSPVVVTRLGGEVNPLSNIMGALQEIATSVNGEVAAQVAAVAAVFGAKDYPDNTKALSNGLASIAITAGGTGGTTGTYAWTTTGGAGSNASGYLTVAGGAITSVVVEERGYDYTSAPTIVIAGSHGVTGHTLTPSLAVNRPIGSFWRIKIANGWEVFENVASVATSRGTYPDKAFISPIADLLVQRVVGPIDPVPTGTDVGNTNYYYWPLTLKSYEQGLTEVEFGVAAAASFRLAVCFVEGDGSLTLVSSHDVSTDASGVATGLEIIVPAGCVVGATRLGGASWKYTPGTIPNGESQWTTSALPTTSTAKTSSTLNGIHWRMMLDGELLFKTRTGYETTQDVSDRLGAVIPFGWDNIVDTGTDTPVNYSVLKSQPEANDGFISRAEIGAAASGLATIFTATLSGLNATIVRSQVVTLIDGVADIPLAIPVAAGEYIGIMGGGYLFQNAVNPSGLAVYIRNGAISSGSAVTLSSTHRYEVKLEVSTGLVGEVAKIANDDGLQGLVKEDAASTLAQVRSRVWGPGALTVDGVRAFIPSAPALINYYDGLRSALMEHAVAGDVLVLNGDSKAAWAFAEDGAQHYFNELTSFANLGVAADEPIMTSFIAYSSYVPSFYGVTVTGGSAGSVGPLGESLVLADGDYFEFTGIYETIGAWYEQKASQGSLVITRGATTLATLNAAGAVENDKFTGEIATGVTSSATYRFAASGGPVDVTGLLRLGVKVAGSGPRLRTMRASHGSYTFASFNAPRMAAIMKQASYAGGVGVPILANGINDSFGTPPATILSNAEYQIDTYEAAGAPRIFAIMPERPTSGWNSSYTGGRTYDGAMGPLRRLYRKRGVDVFPTDMIDWAGLGLLPDGLHGGPSAQPINTQVMIEGFINAVRRG